VAGGQPGPRGKSAAVARIRICRRFHRADKWATHLYGGCVWRATNQDVTDKRALYQAAQQMTGAGPVPWSVREFPDKVGFKVACKPARDLQRKKPRSARLAGICNFRFSDFTRENQGNLP
jgi:hypothetical protein